MNINGVFVQIHTSVCMKLGLGHLVAWDVRMMGQEEDVGSVNSYG